MKKNILYSVFLVFTSFFIGFSQKTETNKIPPGGGGGGELEITYYRDADNDTYGDRNNYILSLNPYPPLGYVENDLDCDDTNASISYYDITYYYDYDHDGYGNPLVSITQSCLLTPPKFYTIDNTDCDDANNSINSGVAWYLDENSDGFITPNETTVYYGCYAPNENYINSLYQNFHWIHNTLYDINNNIISNSRVYYDDLGRSNLTLSKDIANNKIWASETIYDSFGRASKTSFPAISSYSGFNKIGLLSTSNYSPLNNLGVYNGYYPTTTDLATYYSNNNTVEPYQATATHPYTEVEYDKLNPGNVIRSFGGNKINNEWKTGYSYTVPAAQEMYYVFGHNFFESPILSGNKKEIITKFYKTVNVDPHGIETVAFTDGEGKTLAVGRSGHATSKFLVHSLIGTQGYIDVHIPAGISSTQITLMGGNSNYTAYDLKTGQLIATSSLTGGNAYRIVANSIPTTDSKVYVSNTNPGTLTYDSGAKGISYWVNYYDFSVNVYNKTGQLVKVVQPNGYENNTTIKDVPAHMSSNATAYITTYKYNSLGQLIETKSPDEGISKFAYRKDGNIRYSQSALQAGSNEVSYTQYDEYARPIESGVIRGVVWANALANVDTAALISGQKSEQTFSIYDYETNYVGDVSNDLLNNVLISNSIDPNRYKQNNLSGNVVSSFNSESKSWYSYDIYGRLEWMVQNIRNLGVKTIDYEYDAKGQVKKVIYQKHIPSETFVHRYNYDNNGQLKVVETSTNNTTFQNHAEYSYYLDGKLKRVQLAEGIQGTDYVYTLGGMLKSINHPSLLQSMDPGNDDNDVFGITLDYYSGDYTRANTNITSSNSVGSFNPDNYDGNIKAVRWANKQLDGPVTANGASIVSYLYKYNKNKWLENASFSRVNNFNVIDNPTDRWKEGELSYDANGNITRLSRYNNQEENVDRLDYFYSQGTNQLHRVKDGITNGYSYDFPSGQNDDNYKYNAIGQLIDNDKEKLLYFYNTQGLTTEVQYKINNRPIVKFYYNERGERIKKEFYGNQGGSTVLSTDYYVSDASGNIVSIYQKSGSIVSQKEMPVYGSGRLGVFYKGSNPSLDYTNYQITDHLGNVRSVIKRNAGTNFPLITQYADYYPFGEQLPSRNSLSNYRFAFQGQELDQETGMEAFKLRLWDGRIGRWLNPDPYGQHYSPYLGMGNNPISSIDPDGGWETKFGRWLGWAFRGFKGEKVDDPDATTSNLKYGIRDFIPNSSYTYTEDGAGNTTSVNYSGAGFNYIYSSKTDDRNIWNSKFVRGLTGDKMDVSFGTGFGSYLGLNMQIEATWLLRGRDASFLPYINILPSPGGGIEIGAGGSFTLENGRGIFNGSVSDITAMSLLGPEVYLSGTVATPYGGLTSEKNAAIDPGTNKITWISTSRGIAVGAEGSIALGARINIARIHLTKGFYGTRYNRQKGAAETFHGKF